MKVNMLTVHFGDCEPCQFLPGINQVTDTQLKNLLQHPLVKNLIKDGKLVVLNESKNKEGRQDLNEMLSYIPKIFDKKLLKKIIKEEDRVPVLEAAKNQLETISVPKAKEAEPENEHFK
jgi:hypothetical protein